MKFLRKGFFDRKAPVASGDLLLLTKSNVRWFLLKRVDLVIVRVSTHYQEKPFQHAFID